MIGAAAYGAGQQKYPLLVFEFPDGVRGGIGKVSGLGSSHGNDTFALRRCGFNRSQRFDRVTHRIFVYGPASSRDQQIVKCFKMATRSHFNVGYGQIDQAFGIPRILDVKPFEKLAEKAR